MGWYVCGGLEVGWSKKNRRTEKLAFMTRLKRTEQDVLTLSEKAMLFEKGCLL